MTFFGSREDEARELHDRALACIDQGELREARAIADRLLSMRWSGAFQIRALAARAEGDLEGALRALDEGTSLASSVWSLHELRGIVLDALGRSDDAIAALDRALACPEAWLGSIRFNRAVARMRAGDVGGALADAESVLEDRTCGPMALDALRIAIDALAALGRGQHAISLVETVSSSVPGEDTHAAAELGAFAALVAARGGASAEHVRALCDAAIDGGASRSSELVEALASIAPAEVVAARYRVTIAGPAPKGAGPEIEGYLRVVEVRARDVEHATELARTLEPRSVRGAIATEACERIDAEPGRAGVLGASARIYHGG